MYVGIDLHTNRFTCCYLGEDTGRHFKTFNLTPNGLADFVLTVNKTDSVLLEATINSFRFAQAIQPWVKSISIANTFKLKLISFTNKKTDTVDAEKLARIAKMQDMSGEDTIHPVYVPEKVIQDLRALFSTYRLIRKHIVSTKNRIHSLLKQNLYPFTKEFIFSKKQRQLIRDLSQDVVLSFQINQQMDQLEYLEIQADRVQDQIRLAAVPYYQQIDILTSMRGISVITACAILAEIGDVKRFPSSKHFSSYLRSTPGVSSSNETIHNKSTNKQGRKVAITLISQSLNHQRYGNPKLARWADRMVQYKKKGVVRMALCRRVFTEIYQMLKKNEYHYFRDAKIHHKKMMEYQKFLSKNGINMEHIVQVA